jgi:hypothetical protein
VVKPVKKPAAIKTSKSAPRHRATVRVPGRR